MKKLLVLAFMAVTMVACVNTGNKGQFASKDIFYKYEKVGEAGIVSIDTDDYFETGVLTIDGTTYKVKRAVSADGIKLENKAQGVAIHFKNGEGIVDTKDGEIRIREMKK